MSRKKGGTSNYVIFDDQLAEILKRNEEQMKRGGAVIMKEGGEVHAKDGGNDWESLKKLTPFYGAKPPERDLEEELAAQRLKDLEGRVLERDYVEPQKFDLTGEARARLQTGLEKVMPRESARRATSTMLGGEGSNLPFGIGLADVTPAGLPLFGFEAGQSLGRSYEAAKRGDVGEAALEGTIGTLGILPAAPLAVSGAKAAGRAAKKAAPAAREAARGALESAMESGAVIDPRMSVVKPAGGQWLNTGKPLLRPTYGENLRMTPGLGGAEKDQALIDWRDKQLTNYVKTQMGSPDDPILKMAEAWPAEKAAMLDEKRARIASLKAKRKAIEEGTVPAGVRDPDAWRQARTRTIDGDIASIREEMDNIMEMSPIHMPLRDVALLSDTASRREAAGFPATGTAQSEFGRMWETMSDRELKNIDAWKLASEEYLPKITTAERENLTAAFKPGLMAVEPPHPWLTPKQAQEARHFGQDPDFSRQIIEQNPWLSKLDPGEQVYGLMNQSRLMPGLGFDHIMDVLRADVATGRLKPEQLRRMSVEDAVRRTSQYDAEKAAQMARAEATSAANLTPHREFGGGYRLVQLDKPGQFSKESQLMGHSVEGYEPPRDHPDWMEEAADEGSLSYGHGGWEGIKSGEAQVLSFRDTKNRPHATIEVAKVKPPVNPWWNTLSNEEKAAVEASGLKAMEAQGLSRPTGGSSPEAVSTYIASFSPEFAEYANLQPRVITQIKGKGNKAVNEDYWPYLQRYIRESNSEVVDDLDKIGMVDARVAGGMGKQWEYDKKFYYPDMPKYMTESEFNRWRSTGEFTPDDHLK